MNNQENNDQFWQQLMKAAFPPYHPSHPEAFVTRVMARIETKGPSSREFLNFGWRIPTFMIGALSALFFLMIQPDTRTVSTEMLLLTDGLEESTSTGTKQEELVRPEELLTFPLEDY